MGLLRAIETRAENALEKRESNTNPLSFLLKVLSDPRLIKSLDESKLLNDEVIRDAHTRTADTLNRGTLDRSDFSLLLRIVQLLAGAPTALRRRTPYKHIVIDEVQDYSPVELATVLSSLTTQGTLTLVGDTAQRVEEGFPGWEKLRRWWTARRVESSFVRLQVSHR
jgi:DNA helicase IV